MVPLFVMAFLVVAFFVVTFLVVVVGRFVVGAFFTVVAFFVVLSVGIATKIHSNRKIRNSRRVSQELGRIEWREWVERAGEISRPAIYWCRMIGCNPVWIVIIHRVNNFSKGIRAPGPIDTIKNERCFL